jgi:DNA-3-methyladenine glycosylase
VVATEAEVRPLAPAFYARDALDVAHDVLGAHVTVGEVTLRITEVEAYRGPTDTAAHARFGLTARTATLFGPPGHAYVYLCYGLHWMLNFVTTGDGSAVLVRAAEPVAGLELGELAGPGR